jgi:AcrR family transcriptional regulator
LVITNWMENQPQTTRQRRANRTRNLILYSALELLKQVGLENLSLRELARRVDYSPAAIYEYFTDKNALLLALFEEADTQLNRSLEELPKDLNPSDHLIAAGMSYIRFARQNPQLYQLFNNQSGGAIKNSWSYRTIIQIIREGIKLDEFKTHAGFAADEMAFIYRALMHGIASQQNQDSDGPQPDTNLINLHALETMVRGLQVE